MINKIKTILKHQVSILLIAGLISALALIAALIAQFVFDLEPCILCLYQRIPFALIALVTGGSLIWPPARRIAIPLCALLFLSNTGLAFYHVGVEQQWWVSAFEACAVPAGFLAPAQTTQNLLDQLLATPSVPCTQIAWVDPVFGASMAVYNVLLCAGMAALCSLSLLIKR